MPSDLIELPKYSQCEYSLFISYAHSDDKSNNWWVTSLKEAIWDRIDLLPRDISRLGMHISGENGPSVGSLSEALKKRVRSSFGMLLVVGDQYVTSGWCEEELRLFHEIYGNEGIKTRLFVAVMSEKALKDAAKGEQWRRIITKDTLWVQMYDDKDRNSPLVAKLDERRFATDFFDRVKKIADPLMAEIRNDFERSQKVSRADGANAVERGPWAAKRSVQMHVGIAPHTARLTDKSAALKNALEKVGANVTVIDNAIMEKFDPDNVAPLRAALQGVDVLVVPITHEVPMQPYEDGGHATILAEQWDALKKARPIVWYRPADIDLTDVETAVTRHVEKFEQLAPVCASEQAVADLLFGVGAGSTIKVYIEKHAKEPAVFRLSRELERAWAALPPDPARPALRCVPLPLNGLNTAPNDAAAVVLLLPEGLKDTAALKDQQTQVEKQLPKKVSPYPGCVALIFNEPPAKDVPVHDWADVKFCRQAEELVIDVDSELWLNEFLKEVWIRYQKEVGVAR